MIDAPLAGAAALGADGAGRVAEQAAKTAAASISAPSRAHRSAVLRSTSTTSARRLYVFAAPARIRIPPAAGAVKSHEDLRAVRNAA